MNTRKTLKVNENNHLEIGGIDSAVLVEQFGTPLYVMDIEHIENMCKAYSDTLKKEYYDGRIYYASKAFCCKEIYRIIDKFGLGADAVSEGEMFTAKSAGFNLEKVIFHGNNKSHSEIEYAVTNSVGFIVIDSMDDADIVNEISKKHSKVQPVLIRVNPSVEAHTHRFIQTATPDSKFGFSIENGDALEIVKKVISLSNISLKGFHCHIGSQIFEKQGFILAIRKMTDFYKTVKENFSLYLPVINLGGGIGIWYTDEDAKYSYSDYADFVSTICSELKRCVKEKNLEIPYLILEPGRSIVGEAGITLYTVGAVKKIKGLKNYLSIDGGMFENPRYALYQAKYSAVAATSMNEELTEQYSIVGKCCESGDIITENTLLPEMKRGDLLAVLSTGAYNYSMSSNYNRNKIPTVVGVKNGKAFVMVKGQTLDDLIKLDV